MKTYYAVGGLVLAATMGCAASSERVAEVITSDSIEPATTLQVLEPADIYVFDSRQAPIAYDRLWLETPNGVARLDDWLSLAMDQAGAEPDGPPPSLWSVSLSQSQDEAVRSLGGADATWRLGTNCYTCSPCPNGQTTYCSWECPEVGRADSPTESPDSEPDSLPETPSEAPQPDSAGNGGALPEPSSRSTGSGSSRPPER